MSHAPTVLLSLVLLAIAGCGPTVPETDAPAGHPTDAASQPVTGSPLAAPEKPSASPVAPTLPETSILSIPRGARVWVRRGGAKHRSSGESDLQSHDLITTDRRSTAVLVLANGCRVSLDEASRVRVWTCDSKTAELELIQGRLTEIDAREATLTVNTIYGHALQLAGATATARVDVATQVQFQRLSTGTATVISDGREIELDQAPWTIQVTDVGEVLGVEGIATCRRGKKTVDLAKNSRLLQGDVLSAEKGGVLRLRLSAEELLTLVGESRLQLVESNAQGRRVRLEKGKLQQLLVCGIALEVQGPKATGSLVLQNARAVVEILDGGVMEVSGVLADYAKIFKDGKLHDLKDGRWRSDQEMKD